MSIKGLVTRLFAALIALLILAACALWLTLRGSLPKLDGQIVAGALSGPVTLARDELGIPAITGQNRLDVAFVTGFAHAQDRFFQMDLLRRAGAGELAALFGPQVLPIDRERRLHRFRARAQSLLGAVPPEDRALLEHYTAGVNEGLAQLAVRPFEYLLLGLTPKPWQLEDSLLVVWAMYFDLQAYQEPREVARRWFREHCTAEQYAFFFPTSTRYDAPLDASSIGVKSEPLPASAPSWLGKHVEDRLEPTSFLQWDGSSNWAIDGARSALGSAIVANDMHLPLRLPHIWYRSELDFADANGTPRRVAGVTLPGAPVVVVGSNGSVAWGFTNSFGRYLEHVELQGDPSDQLRFQTPGGWERAKEHRERIDVRGGPPEDLTVRETTLGPVKEINHRLFADHWVAHAPSAVNLELVRMEAAQSVEAAMRIANRAGIPAQNFVVGDRAGHIGWSIAGPLPKQNNAVVPPVESRAERTKFSDEMLAPERYPRILDPAGGQIWTANNRQLAGPGYTLVGDGGPLLAARARQIRDRLTTLQPRAQVRDVFEIGLDDRALFMADWRDRALRVLDAQATKGHIERAEFRRILADEWTGRASADSVAYTLVRDFLRSIYDELFTDVDRGLRQTYPEASFAAASPQWPATAARLLDEAPDGWFPEGRSMRDVQLAAVDRTIAALSKDGKALSAAKWGQRNRTDIAHPFAHLMPLLKPFLSAPQQPQDGDLYMPHVTAPGYGQSERMAVAPGHEEQGYLCMPGGESGHPLSPYFLAGHEAWMSGRCSSFLPGAPRHSLFFAAR